MKYNVFTVLLASFSSYMSNYILVFFDNFNSKLNVVHFAASWAPQCSQMNDVMMELLKDSQTAAKINYIKVNAKHIV